MRIVCIYIIIVQIEYWRRCVGVFDLRCELFCFCLVSCMKNGRRSSRSSRRYQLSLFYRFYTTHSLTYYASIKVVGNVCNRTYYQHVLVQNPFKRPSKTQRSVKREFVGNLTSFNGRVICLNRQWAILFCCGS